MTKSDLIRALAAKNGLKKAEVADVVNGFLELITTSLSVGEEVKLELFGKFEPRDRKPVTRRNPRTGGSVEVPARTTVGFKPSSVMKARLNGE